MVNMQTIEPQIPARDRYIPPPIRSLAWIAELRRASEECELLLWGLASKGQWIDAEEFYTVAKAHKIARELTKLANEKLSQIGYGT